MFYAAELSLAQMLNVLLVESLCILKLQDGSGFAVYRYVYIGFAAIPKYRSLVKEENEIVRSEHFLTASQ